MNNKIVRLKSGEELLAAIVKEGEHSITLDKPCIVLPTGENGQIGLYRFMPYAKADTIVIQKVDTYFIVEPQADLDSYYESIVNPSTIMQPKKPLVGI